MNVMNYDKCRDLSVIWEYSKSVYFIFDINSNPGAGQMYIYCQHGGSKEKMKCWCNKCTN